MIHVNSWNDLSRFGIKHLTGEACRLGRRFLVDLTAQGRGIVAEMFGLRPTQFAEPWNGGDVGDPHVASFMVPRSMFTELAVFALLSKCREVVLLDDSNAQGVRAVSLIMGIEEGDTPEDVAGMIEAYRKYDMHVQVVKVSDGIPGIGTRAMHMVTGRTA